MRKNPLSNMSAHGGIITSEFLEIIRGEKVANPKVQSESFATFNAAAPKNKAELDQWIVDSWDRLRERWDSLSNRYLKMNVSDARSKWIIPLFKELGFDLGFIKEEIVVDGDDKLRFRLSHRGWISAGAPMLHMVAPSQDLEEASDCAEGEVVRRGRSRSPHDELQAYLNVTKGSKWGIVTNGVLLRILREYYHTTTKGYVEFDIENIFRERSFTDFRALYRMAHASRFMPDKDGVCPLEQFYKESVAAGVTVGENLRRNVKKAIETLGNGFLTTELTNKMTKDEDSCKAYYSELLRVIYRLLFLLFAEQRAMLPTRDSLYAEEYSITRLREMAETRRGKDNHFDLWEGLKVTFQMLKRGCPPLKVFGYNGSLFDDAELSWLSKLPCKNGDILEAIKHLTLVEEEKVLKRINYLDLGVSEIGSIYESLLDFLPRVFDTEQEIDGEKIPANMFFLDSRGSGRKTTGSYYTKPRLIDRLIESALKPVVEEKLARSMDKEKELFSIKVCDPACGSGAFLIAANNYLARELAKLRTGEANPSDKELRKATRDVLQHCIYGVDVNPMAVELAKVSLWINSCVEDFPLNFLDHHIKPGNSIIGITPELLKKGIPDEAFTPLEDDDKEFAKGIRFQNSTQRKDKLIAEFWSANQQENAEEYALLDNIAENATTDVEEKKKKYNSLVASPELKRQKASADTWVAAFFWSLKKDVAPPPTQGILRLVQSEGMKGIDPKKWAITSELNSKYHFFHWHLEFPDIFREKDSGFDCILGNPPWETIEIKEVEFFEQHFPEILKIESIARKREIAKLKKLNPNLWNAFVIETRKFNSTRKYLHNSGRFPLTGKGKTNSYSVFAELSYNLINRNGKAGLVLPTGIATDDNNKEFFAQISQQGHLVSLFDFENKEGIFPDVHRSYKFCLFTIQKQGRMAPTEFMFFLTSPEQMADQNKRFALTARDFALLNPNTKTCPIFRSKRDAEITKGVYNRYEILVAEGRTNAWGICFKQGFFNMTMDLNLFKDAKTLRKEGFILEGNLFRKGKTIYLPLYEGKMLQLFDHRAASVITNYENILRKSLPEKTTEKQHKDIAFVPLPRYWVLKELCFQALSEYYYSDWLFGFKNVTSTTNERTFIGGVLPMAAVGHSMPLILFRKSVPNELRSLLVANMSSRVFDYITRQKVGGVNLTFFIINQLPVIPPNGYPKKVAELLKQIMLEMVYTSNDILPFALSLGYSGPPFVWHTEKRKELIARLEAIYGILYGLTRDDFDYVFESFWSTKRQEAEQYGEYRSKILALQYYDEYSVKLNDK